MTTPVSSIRNLGAAMEKSCARAGITSAEELRDLGADAAYRALLLSDTRPHFIGYYALVMGLQGRPWNDCHGVEKTTLRGRFDQLCADVSPTTHTQTALERELDRIGVIALKK